MTKENESAKMLKSHRVLKDVIEVEIEVEIKKEGEKEVEKEVQKEVEMAVHRHSSPSVCVYHLLPLRLLHAQRISQMHQQCSCSSYRQGVVNGVLNQPWFRASYFVCDDLKGIFRVAFLALSLLLLLPHRPPLYLFLYLFLFLCLPQ